MAGVIFDASAVLALLRDEPGAAKVETMIADARISVVNFAEVISYYAKQGSDGPTIARMLRALPIAVVPAEEDLALAAGMLRPLTLEAGLSLGDRFCLALAKREKATAVTADRVWTTIASEVGVKVSVIR